jgi:long-chain fatty acid transport protein
LQADPFIVAPPDDANGDGVPTFPPGTHTRWHWGGGVQAGVYYAREDGWRLGASVKSPLWFESFHFQSTDEIGRPRSLAFDVDLPLIASVGGAYSGFERWLLGVDFHYIDYKNANGLRDSGFAPTGAVRGVGQRSIWAVALGAQYQLTDTVSLRAGYTYNDDPVDDAHAFFNVGSPTIIEQTISVGASYKVTDSFTLSMAYAHAFQNSVTGSFVTPFGSVPGTSVTNVVSADTFVIGGTVRFGGSSDGY